MRERTSLMLLSMMLLLFSGAVASAVTLEPPVRLTADSAYSGYPTIAGRGQDVVVAWHDKRHGENEIFVKYSGDAGDTWSMPVRVTQTPSDSSFPRIAMGDNGTVHLVYQDNRPRPVEQNFDIFYRQSTDGGRTWTNPRGIVQNAGKSLTPDIAVDGNVVHVVWTDITNGMFDVYYSRSEDNGARFSRALQLTSKPDSQDPDSNLPQQPPSLGPRVEAQNGRVALVWYDCRHDREPLREPYPDNYEIYYQESADGGLSWGAAQRLTNDLDESTHPAVAMSPAGEVAVAWSEGGGHPTRELGFLREDAAGGFADEVRLGGSPYLAMYPVLLSLQGGFHLFWQDNRDDQGGTWQVYHQELDAAGLPVAAAAALTSTKRFAGYPDAIELSGTFHLVYMDDQFSPDGDNRINNFEIMYMRGQ